MQEKELRLAIVCSGGVSLAVYMHGITKELLKLVRASKLYHGVPDIAAKQHRNFDDLKDVPGQLLDTEEVYFDILKEIGESLDMRVIIDVIAGASAGGINGLMLGRALAHDLAYEPLRNLWLKNSDIRELVSPEQNYRWSEKIFRPLIRWISGDRIKGLELDDEVTGKLVSMLQIGAARAPFSGERLVGNLMDAMEEMGEPPHAGASLLPAGHQLELFVTLTDFFGYAQKIPLYDPPIIEEREHRHILRFGFQRWPNGDVITDFDGASIPALTFAARATSSFPGVFPPAQIGEIDRVMKARGAVWNRRDYFLKENFEPYHRAGTDPTKTSFIDGSVLNNKPFGAAIQAIEGRPAYRQVDRRLIYINPNPAGRPPPPTGDAPGILRTLKGSLSDIPRNEPIYSDLAWIEDFNQQVRRTKAIIEAARPDVEKAVEGVAKGRLSKKHLTAEQVSRWRDTANEQAAKAAGFAINSYVRLKLAAALDFLRQLLLDLFGVEESSPEGQFIAEAIESWAALRGIQEGQSWDTEPEVEGGELEWVALLRQFDIDFRRRRIRFVIQGLNKIYSRLDEPEYEGLNAYRLDYIKGRLYEVLESIRRRQSADTISLEAANRAKEVLAEAFRQTGTSQGPARFASRNLKRIDELVTSLARDLALEDVNHSADDIFASMEFSGAAGGVRREMLINYLGYSFWDILTLSVANWRDLGEFDEIRVTRVSPEDAGGLRKGKPEDVLKGVQLGNFGAFFKRSHRENDYLWGRLHGAERLIDVLVDAAKTEGGHRDLDVFKMKKKAFELILRAERGSLQQSDDLLDQLEREVAGLPDE